MPGPSGVIVAPKKLRCRTCELPDSLLQLVNAAIWTPEQVRHYAYARNAVAVLAAHGRKLHRVAIARHAAHVELSWRRTIAGDPASGAEKAVFPIDFEQYVGRAAAVGGKALEQLERNVGSMRNADLVGVARLGVSAVAAKQAAADAAAAREAKSKQPATRMLAIYGIVSGHLDTPAGEIRNVTPVAELMDELRAERDQLRLSAGYDDELAIEEALA